MEMKPKITKPSIYDTYDWFSQQYCLWVLPFFRTFIKHSNLHTNQSSITIEDLDRCAKDNEAKRLYERFETYYNVVKTMRTTSSVGMSSSKSSSFGFKSKSTTSLFAKLFSIKNNIFLYSLLLTFRAEALAPFLLLLLQDCVIKPLQPILIGYIIRYFYELSNTSTTSTSTSTISLTNALLMTMALFISSLALIASHHPSIQLAMRLSMRVKIVWSTMIYNKVNASFIHRRNLSQLINMITNDVRRFDEFALMSNYLLIVPVQTLIFLALTWHYIGASCLVTFFAFIILAYLLSALGKYFATLRTRTVVHTEQRLRLLQELFCYIRAIKIYTIESKFLRKIFTARRVEIFTLKLSLVLRSIILSFSMVSSRVITYFSFLLYFILFDSSHDRFYPEMVFVSVTLFERLRYSLTWTFPLAISGLHDVLASCERISDFLFECESNETKQEQQRKNSGEVKRKYFDEFKRHHHHHQQQPKGIWVSNLNVRYPSSFDSPSSQSDTTIDSSTEQQQPQFHLSNITLSVEPGESVSIIGPVGSGKSTLLLTLLDKLLIDCDGNNGGKRHDHECHGSADRFLVNGTIAYVSQEVYCLTSTVRENILFGREYNHRRYQQVLEICALEHDLAQFPAGDQTQVGENGSNISGGQRARINLARALYTDADIYLLDDLFSAVDAHLARHIYHRCIEQLLAQKVVLIATHQLQFIPQSTRILLLGTQGQSVAYGDFDSLMSENKQFAQFFNLTKYQSSMNVDTAMAEMEPTTTTTAEAIKSNDNNSIEQVKVVEKVIQNEKKDEDMGVVENYEKCSNNDDSSDSISAKMTMTTDDNHVGCNGNNAQQLNQTKTMLKNKKSEKVNSPNQSPPNDMHSYNDLSIITQYWSYLRQSSVGIGSIYWVLLSAILTPISLYVCDHWLTLWNQTTLNRWEFFLIYTIIVLAIVILAILRSISFVQLCLAASERTHNVTVEKLVHAPIDVVEHYSVGKLLNFFTRDVGILDETFCSALFELNLSFFQVFSIVGVILYINPYLSIITVIYLGLLYLVRQYYSFPSHVLRNFEVQSRNHIFNHLNSTITGLTTIRSYSVADIFRQRFYSLLNDHTATIYLQLSTSRFFCTVIDLFAFVYIYLVVAMLFMFSASSTSAATNNASLIGLCLNTIFNLIGVTQWAVKRSIDSDLWIVSFQNLLQFHSLPAEEEEEEQEEEVAQKRKLDAGDLRDMRDITMDNLSVYYNQSNSPVDHDQHQNFSTNDESTKRLILQNVNLKIEFGEKIGICGRSGSGKSTLVNAFLRFAAHNGSLRINDHRIEQYRLRDLRRHISIIPQDPVIFSGTIRENLDLFNQLTDDQLWAALERVQLRPMVEQLERQLDEPINIDSTQLSLGQKQLICLARIMLQNNPLVILDEATASVDFHTDKLIQHTIRSVFCGHCTMITIAHRLDSIIDCDRILVFNQGRVVEDDTPRRLLSNKKSYFSQLVKQTGPKMSARLEACVLQSGA